MGGLLVNEKSLLSVLLSVLWLLVLSLRVRRNLFAKVMRTPAVLIFLLGVLMPGFQVWSNKEVLIGYR